MYAGHRNVEQGSKDHTLEKNKAVQSLLFFSVHMNLLLHVLSAVTSIQKVYTQSTGLISIHHS